MHHKIKLYSMEDGIGSIKVLKIIDIGSEVKVISTDANRLIKD